jgi:hypothetical protein
MFVVLRNSAPYYSIYDNEIQLKNDLIVFLDFYREQFGYYHINYRDMNIDEIVSFSMELSQELIVNGFDYGIVQIIKGISIYSDNDDHMSITSDNLWDLPEDNNNLPLPRIPEDSIIILESREMEANE